MAATHNDTTSNGAKPSVDVFFINIHASSDFRMMRTSTEDGAAAAIMQVSKHLQRGLYEVLSLNVTSDRCVVVFSTQLSREQLLWNNGFPWDRDEEPTTIKTPDL